jgi:serine/threonine protein kinase
MNTCIRNKFLCSKAINEKYEIYDYISSGNFGVVLKVKNLTTNNLVAMKVVKHDEHTLNEINIACYLTSLIKFTPTIIRVGEWFICEEYPSSEWRDNIDHMFHIEREDEPMLFFEMDIMDCTLGFINKNKLKISPCDFKSIIFELIYTLYVIRKHVKFVHGDIKEPNILIKYNISPRIYTINNTKFIAKSKYMPVFADFGRSSMGTDTSDNSDGLGLANILEDLLYFLDEQKIESPEKMQANIIEVYVNLIKDKGSSDFRTFKKSLFLDLFKTLQNNTSNGISFPSI